MAVELLINELHNGEIGKKASFVRGTIGSCYEISEYVNTSFSNCVACSQGVIDEYLKESKNEFLKNVINDPKYLNKFTGFEMNDDQEVCNFMEENGIIILDFPEEESKSEQHN